MTITARRPKYRMHGTTVMGYVGPSPSSANEAPPQHAYYEPDASTARLLTTVDVLLDKIEKTIPGRAPSPAESLKELYDSTALTWDQIARLFGVSRRAVHLWTSGQRMSARNLERLARIGEVVSENQSTTPEATRANLFVRKDGGSPFSMLLAELADSRQESEPSPWAERQPSA